LRNLPARGATAVTSDFIHMRKKVFILYFVYKIYNTLFYLEKKTPKY